MSGMMVNDMTEGDAIGYEYDGDDSSHMDASDTSRRDDQQREWQEAYQAARAASSSTAITCPVCRRTHVKTTYHKVFDQTKCRVRYWNFTNDRIQHV